MATSFYELSVPTFLQSVRALGCVLDRAVDHCALTGADPDDFVGVRLHEDMAPFHFQIEAAWHHAVWGIEAARTGVFEPPGLVGPVPFTELRAMIGKAEAALAAYVPEEVDSWAGRDLDLQIGPSAGVGSGLITAWELALRPTLPRCARKRHSPSTQERTVAPQWPRSASRPNRPF